MPQAPRHSQSGPRAQGGADTDNPEEPLPALEEVDTADLEPPAWLGDANSIDAWNKAVRLMRAMHRRFNPSDLVSLARYAEYVGNWHQYTETLGADGKFIDGRFGLVAHPALAERAKCEFCIRSLEKALGLDPASFLDLTKDLSRVARDKAAREGPGRRAKRVGGFLNKSEGPK